MSPTTPLPLLLAIAPPRAVPWELWAVLSVKLLSISVIGPSLVIAPPKPALLPVKLLPMIDAVPSLTMAAPIKVAILPVKLLLMIVTVLLATLLVIATPKLLLKLLSMIVAVPVLSIVLPGMLSNANGLAGATALVPR